MFGGFLVFLELINFECRIPIFGRFLTAVQTSDLKKDNCPSLAGVFFYLAAKFLLTRAFPLCSVIIVFIDVIVIIIVIIIIIIIVIVYIIIIAIIVIVVMLLLSSLSLLSTFAQNY